MPTGFFGLAFFGLADFFTGDLLGIESAAGVNVGRLFVRGLAFLALMNLAEESLPVDGGDGDGDDLGNGNGANVLLL